MLRGDRGGVNDVWARSSSYQEGPRRSLASQRCRGTVSEAEAAVVQQERPLRREHAPSPESDLHESDSVQVRQSEVYREHGDYFWAADAATQPSLATAKAFQTDASFVLSRQTELAQSKGQGNADTIRHALRR